MKNSLKIIFFILIFSLVFYVLRGENGLLTKYIDLLVDNSAGSGWLYSVAGLIFGLIAAFIILYETERWNNLNDAINREVSAIDEMIIWSQHWPVAERTKFTVALKNYLTVLIEDEWPHGGRLRRNEKVELALGQLNAAIYDNLKVADITNDPSFSLFSDLLKTRTERVHYSLLHIPKILMNTLIFSDLLLVAMSLLIGVPDVLLDYLFTLGIAVLGFVIYLVISDLDQPLSPGGWQVTTAPYEELAKRLV